MVAKLTGRTSLRASIDENAILVSWTNPGTRIDGSRLKDLTEVRLYRREDSEDGPLKPTDQKPGATTAARSAQLFWRSSC